MQTATRDPSEYLRPKQAAGFLNVSLTTLWRLSERDPSFPPKLKITQRLCFYRKSELKNWLDSKEV